MGCFFYHRFLKNARFTALLHRKGGTVKRALMIKTCGDKGIVSCQLSKIFNSGSQAAEEISPAAEDLGEIAQAQAGAGATAQGEAAEVAGGLAVGGVAVLDGVQGL